jgi:predicted acetyltransferase
MTLTLRKLTKEDETAFKEGLSLFSDMDSEWFSFVWKEGMSFEEHLKILDDRFHGVGLRPGLVPDSMLYAFVDGKIVGRASIRHELNEWLNRFGGHIGYAVATQYRMKGYAAEILKQSLDYCRNVLRLDQVLVTCDDDNFGSIKTIEKNGGELENKIFLETENKTKRRYWIVLN